MVEFFLSFSRSLFLSLRPSVPFPLTWRSIPSWHRDTASPSPGSWPRARGSRGPPGQAPAVALSPPPPPPLPPSAGWAGKKVARRPYDRPAPSAGSLSGAGAPAEQADSWRTAVQASTVPSGRRPPGRPGPQGGAAASAHAPGGPVQAARGAVWAAPLPARAGRALGREMDQEAPGEPGMVVRRRMKAPPSSHSVCERVRRGKKREEDEMGAG